MVTPTPPLQAALRSSQVTRARRNTVTTPIPAAIPATTPAPTTPATLAAATGVPEALFPSHPPMEILPSAPAAWNEAFNSRPDSDVIYQGFQVGRMKEVMKSAAAFGISKGKSSLILWIVDNYDQNLCPLEGLNAHLTQAEKTAILEDFIWPLDKPVYHGYAGTKNSVTGYAQVHCQHGQSGPGGRNAPKVILPFIMCYRCDVHTKLIT